MGRSLDNNQPQDVTPGQESLMPAGLSSMTGHADVSGAAGELAWAWEARSVNGRGLDLRIRLPEGFEGLEPQVRAAVTGGFARGSVSVTLRVSRAPGGGGQQVNAAALATAIAGAQAARDAAEAVGLVLAPMTLGELLAMRGVLEAGQAPPLDDPTVRAALLCDLERLVERLARARASEGQLLTLVLQSHVDRIEALVAAARDSATAREARNGSLLRERVEAVTGAAAGVPVDAARLAQELALLAVRLDVTEEIDRLTAHVAAARALLEGSVPVGRRFDFLVQEFNREANTLCSKAQDTALTTIGLELKLVIDRMREQVQNLE